MTRFACERGYVEAVERPFLRNVLISEYCAQNFNVINLVDMYYRQLDSNIIVVILIVLIVFPCLFITMSAAAEGYLAVSLKGLSRRLKFSPSLAATTVVAFANGAPDLLSSLASVHKSESTLMSLATLLGAFMFTSTVVMTNVLYTVPSQIVLPKLAVIKEIGFYTFSIFAVCVLGFFKAKTLTFVTMLLGTYIAYILATIIVEKQLDIERRELMRMNLKDEENGKLRSPEELKRSEANPVNLDAEVDKKIEASQIVNETYANSAPQSINHNMQLIYEELFDPSLPVFRQYCQLLLSVGGLFTIPYIFNPLMGTKARFFVIFGAVYFCCRMLIGANSNIYLYPACAAGVAIFCLLLEIVKINQRFIDTLYEIIAAFAAVSWIKIICVLILDFISFMAFYFSIEEITLATLIISVGNCMSDLFNNTALALHGEPVMAAMAVYSGQTFNLLVGFSLNLLANWKRYGESHIDLFGQDTMTARVLRLFPAKNLVLVVCLCVVFGLLTTSWSYLISNSFVLKRVFGVVLIGFYGAYVTAVILTGMVIKWT